MRALNQFIVGACTALWLTTGYLAAEDTTPKPSPSGVPAATDASTFPMDQVEQLVAPIALYPDALIAQVLMASTYPLDVVQAARWIENHKELEGETLEKAATDEGWDPSVTTLVFFPDVLNFMSENLDWTQDLGDAVLAQQEDVTEAVQKLRHEAQDAGNLASTEQQKVETKGDTIVVQPAQPEVVYVPSYTPSEVYGQSGSPATAYYPATYTEPATPTYVAPATTTVDSGASASDGLIGFGVGALAGGLLTAAIMWDDDDRYDRLYYGGPGYYGGPSYWGRPNYWDNGWREPREINVDRNVERNFQRNVERGDININKGFVGNEIKAGKWEHNPVNRGGVRYRNTEVEKRFANVKRDRYVDREIARGRDPERRRAQLAGSKLPGEVGASKLSAAQRKQLDLPGGGERKLGDKKRPTAVDGKRPALGDSKVAAKAPGKTPGLADAKRPTGKTGVAKPQASRPEAKRPAKKAQVKKPTTRPAKVSQKTRQAVSKPSARRAAPAKQSASAKRPAHAPRGGGKTSAFKVDKASKTRAASNRGAKSRSGGTKSRGGGRSGGGRRG